MLREKIASSIRRGLGYINSSISEEGFWQDFFLTTGKSTAWVTGYLAQILSFLAKQKMASGETRINLKKTKEWIISAADDLGGWGYNQWSGVDADSSTNCLLFLSECEGVPEEIQRKALEVILNNQNPSDGGFATFSATEIKRQIDKGNPWFPPPPEQYSGWCSSDTYITALSAYTLALVNREFYWDRILRALDFVMGEQSGSGYWNAYWSNGRMLGTFACVRLLRELNVGKRCVESAVRWVRGLQNGPGAWSDGVSGRPTPFDTALALQILMMADRQGGMEMIAMGVRWLVNSQLPDGSWKSFPWLAVPHCAKVKSYRKDDFSYEDKGVNDHRRLFTTATVLSALSHYWVDRNLR
jgi:squalene cyclase